LNSQVRFCDACSTTSYLIGLKSQLYGFFANFPFRRLTSQRTIISTKAHCLKGDVCLKFQPSTDISSVLFQPLVLSGREVCSTTFYDSLKSYEHPFQGYYFIRSPRILHIRGRALFARDRFSTLNVRRFTRLIAIRSTKL